ncbi:hypothetical protein HK101_006802 [Irineochytrium annulatum]|nr:hypothetical protein HK101_006802 [Irineochytrium annulatum]
MTPLQLGVGAVGLVAGLITFWVNITCKVFPVLVCTLPYVTLKVIALVFAFALQAVSPPDFALTSSGQLIDPSWDYQSATFTWLCNLESALCNGAEAACFGAATTLTVELYLRTSTKSIMRADVPLWRQPKTWFYVFLSLVVPVIVGLVSFWAGVGHAHFVRNSFCDTAISPLTFMILHACINGAYSVIGSSFLSVAIYTYIRQWREILDVLEVAEEQRRGRTRPPHVHLVELSSTTSAVATSIVSDMNSGALHNHARSTARGLLQILVRMATYGVMFHLLAIYHVLSEFLLVYQHWDKPYIGGGTEPEDSARRVLVLYCADAASLTMFVCFATGQNAMTRYRGAYAYLFGSPKAADEESVKSQRTIAAPMRGPATSYYPSTATTLPPDEMRPSEDQRPHTDGLLMLDNTLRVPNEMRPSVDKKPICY